MLDLLDMDHDIRKGRQSILVDPSIPALEKYRSLKLLLGVSATSILVFQPTLLKVPYSQVQHLLPISNIQYRCIETNQEFQPPSTPELCSANIDSVYVRLANY
ncbi:hypothetical protein KC19_7G170600 [Ceratodon purpureus]|uniref:Uncharacterized protein n=1 Tax=Ceratodon purpureus TaxID=3225 RepID=A0A8T0H7J7_CERPU|nr:hypothetical protein KC19_7G170600 [Ceratodon purpureus]